MRIETERKMKRWREQRWILDQVIQSRGIDWDQGRSGKILRNCGPSVEKDLTDLCSRIKKFVDIPQQFSQAAARREEQGRAAEGAGFGVPRWNAGFGAHHPDRKSLDGSASGVPAGEGRRLLPGGKGPVQAELTVEADTEEAIIRWLHAFTFTDECGGDCLYSVGVMRGAVTAELWYDPAQVRELAHAAKIEDCPEAG
jgi:hypothetical protein